MQITRSTGIWARVAIYATAPITAQAAKALPRSCGTVNPESRLIFRHIKMPVHVSVMSVARAAPLIPKNGMRIKLRTTFIESPIEAYARKCFWLLWAIKALLIVAVAKAIGTVKSRIMYDAVAGKYSTP